MHSRTALLRHSGMLTYATHHRTVCHSRHRRLGLCWQRPVSSGTLCSRSRCCRHARRHRRRCSLLRLRWLVYNDRARQVSSSRLSSLRAVRNDTRGASSGHNIICLRHAYRCIGRRWCCSRSWSTRHLNSCRSRRTRSGTRPHASKR